MKNYKKIYNKFIKEIRNTYEQTKKYNSNEETVRSRYLDLIENNANKSLLKFLLDISKEIEGKKFNSILMNESKFKKWKKEIKK